MRIYEKRASFVRPDSKFGAKFAIIWKNEKFSGDFEALIPSFSLTLNVKP
jgi:hypothetical protein